MSDKFKTLEEVKEKFLIRVIGDTEQQLLLDIFNSKYEEEKVVELLYDITNPKPYNILNLARYYKYILNNDDKYIEYVMKAKDLGCMDSYSVITWNIITQNKLREAVEYIENDEKTIGLDLKNLPITTIENMVYCGELLNDNTIIEKYTKIKNIIESN